MNHIGRTGPCKPYPPAPYLIYDPGPLYGARGRPACREALEIVANQPRPLFGANRSAVNTALRANPEPGEGCGNFRSPRIQRFTWNVDGTPNFGTPVPLGQPLEKPAGSH